MRQYHTPDIWNKAITVPLSFPCFLAAWNQQLADRVNNYMGYSLFQDMANDLLYPFSLSSVKKFYVESMSHQWFYHELKH